MLKQQATVAGQVPVIIKPGTDAAQAVYRAFKEQRSELDHQLDQLEDKRRGLMNQLSELGPGNQGPGRTGIEARIADIDKRIADVEKQLAAADQQVAQAAAVPNAIPEEPPPRPRQGPPEEAFVLGGIFIVVVLFPIAFAYARRIWKRGAAAVTAFPQELADRLNRLDQSVDSIAIEVERIGEGQRFVTRVMTEQGARSVGAGAPMPVARDGER